MIPIERAEALADVLHAATKGWSREKADWFVDWEEVTETKQTKHPVSRAS